VAWRRAMDHVFQPAENFLDCLNSPDYEQPLAFTHRVEAMNINDALSAPHSDKAVPFVSNNQAHSIGGNDHFQSNFPRHVAGLRKLGVQALK